MEHEQNSMDDLLEMTAKMSERAWKVIEDTGVIGIWESFGARVNLVGSLKTGLLMNHRDIDFHVYTDPFRLEDSFAAMSRLAACSQIRQISYYNYLDACGSIDWHAFYEDESGDTWQIDIIHLLSDSPYAGHFEKVAERINDVLTPETRQAVLSIKRALPSDKSVMGIQVYRAVFEGGVRDIGGFREWQKTQPNEEIITWMP